MVSSPSSTTSLFLLKIFPLRLGILGPQILSACLTDSLVIGELLSNFSYIMTSITVVIRSALF